MSDDYYQCDTCKDETCTNLTKKTFHKEENNQVVEYSLHYCCYDNGIPRNMLKYWCDTCLSNDKVRERILAERDYTIPQMRNINVYKKLGIDLKHE